MKVCLRCGDVNWSTRVLIIFTAELHAHVERRWERRTDRQTDRQRGGVEDGTGGSAATSFHKQFHEHAALCCGENLITVETRETCAKISFWASERGGGAGELSWADRRTTGGCWRQEPSRAGLGGMVASTATDAGSRGLGMERDRNGKGDGGMKWPVAGWWNRCITAVCRRCLPYVNVMCHTSLFCFLRPFFCRTVRRA